MIRCTITIHITCDKDDSNDDLEQLTTFCQELEEEILEEGFLFTDITHVPCDLKRTYEKEYK